MSSYDSDSDLDEEQYDPIFVIKQYLYENGYENTLKQFDEETGTTFSKSKSQRFGSQLQQMLFEYQENRLSKQMSELELSKRKADDILLERGDGTYANKLVNTLNLHNSNILAVTFSHHKDSNIIATGSSDKTIKTTDFKTQEVLHVFHAVHNGAIIALDFNPNPEFHDLLLSGSMDGTHAIVNIRTKQTVQTFHKHAKYVVSVKWSPDGLLFAAASHDHSVSIYKYNGRSLDGSEGSPYDLVETALLNTNPESMAFNKSGILCIGAREDNYLHTLDLNNGGQRLKFNMNAKMDDHVSFSPLHLNFNPVDDNYLLVSTDKNRLILYRKDSSTPVRNFWGANNDDFSNPRNAWHHSGKYVYSTSQDYNLYCWEVASQTVVSKMERHSSTVRDLSHHPTENLLATCSFDKTVKLWSV